MGTIHIHLTWTTYEDTNFSSLSFPFIFSCTVCILHRDYDHPLYTPLQSCCSLNPPLYTNSCFTKILRCNQSCQIAQCLKQAADYCCHCKLNYTITGFYEVFVFLADTNTKSWLSHSEKGNNAHFVTLFFQLPAHHTTLYNEGGVDEANPAARVS